jgi:hypothetical protein
LKKAPDVVWLDRFVGDFLFQSRSGVAGGAVDVSHLGRLGQLPAQRMFPPAASNNQYLQGLDPSCSIFCRRSAADFANTSVEMSLNLVGVSAFYRLCYWVHSFGIKPKIPKVAWMSDSSDIQHR